MIRFRGTNKRRYQENIKLLRRKPKKLRGKKNGKKLASNDQFSSRLLWNSNGEWFDKWFIHQDGILCGCKEPTTTKQPEIVVDIRSCTLTCYSSNDVLRRLNLFQLSTRDHDTHIFVAWNEEDYELWVDCLSFAVERKQELYGLKLENLEIFAAENDGGETEIIPYERALMNNEQRKAASSSSDTSAAHARVDSIDSGNDGDESGLESSLSCNNKLMETRKKLDKERKTRSGRLSSSNESFRTSTGERSAKISPDEIDYAQHKPQLILELTRQISRDSTSTENDHKSPGFQTEDKVDDGSDFKKTKRNSFIKKKWSLFDKSTDKNKPKKDDEVPCKNNHSRPRDIPQVQGNQSARNSIDQDSVISGSAGSLLHSSRPNSLNISLPEESIDSNLSEHTWEGFGRYKNVSVGSEDDISETYSMPSLVEDHKQEELEDNLREETLLRKRRNSLTLERGQVVIKLETLKDSINNNVKKSNKLRIDTEVARNEKIVTLERRLEHIDTQIEIIDKRIDLSLTPTYKRKKSRRGTSQFMTRLKISGSKSKPLENINSMSVESLSSSASRESRNSLGRECSPSACNANQTFEEAIKKQKITHKRSSDGSEISTVSNDKLQFTGLEELMITTKKLESSNDGNLNQPLSVSDKWRSKSLGSVDLIRSRQQRKKEEKFENNSDTTQSALIIEDFEKFSEMLTNQMKTRQNSAIIEV